MTILSWYCSFSIMEKKKGKCWETFRFSPPDATKKLSSQFVALELRDTSSSDKIRILNYMLRQENREELFK